MKKPNKQLHSRIGSRPYHKILDNEILEQASKAKLGLPGANTKLSGLMVTKKKFYSIDTKMARC